MDSPCTGRRRLVVAVLVVVAAATASLAAQAGAMPRSPAALPGSAQVATMLHGIPQHGAWLGSKRAPLTLVEYVDVQCPYCARFSHDVFPAVVDKYVRSGRVRILFRGLAFLGPESLTGLRWVVAAGHQNRLWNVLELLFANQGRENSGWVTTARLEAVARSVAGLKLVALRRDTQSAAVTAQIRRAAAAARAAAVPGTPHFQAGPSLGKLSTLELKSWNPSEFEAQLDKLLK